MSILTEAQALYPELKALKDDLHRHPELSFQERRTTAVLRERLAPLGLELIDLGMETGVAALLRGARPGRTAALRADIDAIAQQEPADLGVVSEHPGIMHGCGHDFHTACLYGAARLLCARREALAGDVVFLFQPAEEVTQGARAMIDHGLWEKLPRKPDCLFGLHNRPELPRGQVAVLPGPIMAGKRHFTVTLRGVAGHGGSPHKCVDVIVPAAAIVQGVQAILSRNADPMESLVCAVLSIHAGTPENFVPDTLVMTGSIRAHSQQVQDMACRRLEEICRGTAAAYGCTAELAFTPGVPITFNGPPHDGPGPAGGGGGGRAGAGGTAPARPGQRGLRRLRARRALLLLLAWHRPARRGLRPLAQRALLHRRRGPPPGRRPAGPVRAGGAEGAVTGL